MRLPMVVPLSTKDGTSNKNARLTNCLKESRERKDATVWVRGVKQPAPPIDKAVVRPGLVLEATGSGIGGGLVAFNNQLVSVYGATLGFSVTPGAGGWSAATAITFDALGDTCSGSQVVWDGNNFLALVLNEDTGDWLYNNSSDGVSFGYQAAYPGSQTSISGFLPLGAKSGYTYAWDAGNKTRLYRSADSGVSWVSLSTVPLTIGVGEYFLCQWYGTDLYAWNVATAQTCKSTDSGATWGAPYAGSGISGYPLGAYLYAVNGSNQIIQSNDVFLTSSIVGTPPITVLGMAADGSTMYIWNSSYVFYSSTDGVTFTIIGAPAYSFAPIGVVFSNGDLYFFEQTQMFTLTGGGGGGTIPALATIATGLYDFAQGPT